MSTYRLYKSPAGDIVRVKMGFSWQAFFVGSLSAIVRRTWLVAAVGFLFYISWAYFDGAPAQSTRTTAFALALLGFYGVYMVFCGFNASRWLAESLRRRGHTLVGEEKRPFWRRAPRHGGRSAAGRKSYSH